jgi:diguanylate cyclase (GGDEF)-like protein
MAGKNTEKSQQHLRLVLYLIAVITIAMVIEILIMKSLNRQNLDNTSTVLLNQVVSIIEENEKSENQLIKTLKEDYVIRAKTVAYILALNPDAEYDVKELQKIADLMRIDEIHLFDDTGEIYSGTEPKYYGYNFDSGEQMAYFKPMLDNKDRTMCQDVTPNTAEGKSMMYAIVWNETGDRMIQVGIEPLRLLDELRSNEVSSVIANMPAYDGIDIMAAYTATGVICGSTDANLIGEKLSSVGITETGDDLKQLSTATLRISGRRYYGNAKKTGDYVVVVAYAANSGIHNLVVGFVIEFVYLFLAGVIIALMFKKIIRTNDEKEELFYKSNIDQLTGLYNRRAYESDIAVYDDAAVEENLVFISMDVNGLKPVNDNFGHAAGDELLLGAARCMKRCLGPYGKIYRTGGDEFIALIFANEKQLRDIKKEFKTVTSKWFGKLVKKLSISCGYVTKLEVGDISIREMADIADKRMYEAKAEFYETNPEYERRRT